MKKIILYLIVGLVLPIAIPAWAIEGLIRRKFPNWEFNYYTGTPYMVSVSILATYLILEFQNYWHFTGLILLTSIQILSLSTSVSIAIGRENRIQEKIMKYGDRLNKSNFASTFNAESLYHSILSFLFTCFYFGVIYFSIYVFNPNAFMGVVEGSNIDKLVDFFFYSTTTISSLGSNISPNTSTTKILGVTEIFIGLGYVIFLFGAFVSYYISKLLKEEKEA